MNKTHPSPLDLPDFTEPQREPPAPADFESVVREGTPFVKYYLENHDSPEARFLSKNPEPFSL
ncbi:MAG: hypothetical protein ACOYNG_07470 [Terrimicrobiaceae bacterium]|jgi:hypothetical protein